jgi:hypothetical protein
MEGPAEDEEPLECNGGAGAAAVVGAAATAHAVVAGTELRGGRRVSHISQCRRAASSHRNVHAVQLRGEGIGCEAEPLVVDAQASVACATAAAAGAVMRELVSELELVVAAAKQRWRRSALEAPRAPSPMASSVAASPPAPPSSLSNARLLVASRRASAAFALSSALLRRAATPSSSTRISSSPAASAPVIDDGGGGGARCWGGTW